MVAIERPRTGTSGDADAELEHALGRLQPVALPALDQVALQDRFDTKYVLTAPQLLQAIGALGDSYAVLEVAGARRSRYETIYFDTPGLRLYLDHHNGKLNRYKVRSRRYLETGRAFLEVKRRGWSRTRKQRRETQAFVTSLTGREAALLTGDLDVPARDLAAALVSRFRRITLMTLSLPERVTIDTDLSWSLPSPGMPGETATAVASGAPFTMPGLVVAELKRAGPNQRSPFGEEMRRLGVRPGRFSKYCIGVASLYQGVKNNNFRPVLGSAGRLLEGLSNVD